jgi:hypothetical protein
MDNWTAKRRSSRRQIEAQKQESSGRPIGNGKQQQQQQQRKRDREP